MRRSIEGKWGFTLIELLVVCAIIGILAVILFSNLKRAIRKAREAETYGNLALMRTNLDMYKALYFGDGLAVNPNNVTAQGNPLWIFYNSWLNAWVDPLDTVSCWSGDIIYGGNSKAIRNIWGYNIKEYPKAKVSESGDEKFSDVKHYFTCGIYHSASSARPSANYRGWYYWIYAETAQDAFCINNGSLSTEGKRYSTSY